MKWIKFLINKHAYDGDGKTSESFTPALGFFASGGHRGLVAILRQDDSVALFI
ncbi:MAG: hypothetical protein ABFS45_02445 [Pseudomonadota bacterium]